MIKQKSGIWEITPSIGRIRNCDAAIKRLERCILENSKPGVTQLLLQYPLLVDEPNFDTMLSNLSLRDYEFFLCLLIEVYEEFNSKNYSMITKKFEKKINETINKIKDLIIESGEFNKNFFSLFTDDELLDLAKNLITSEKEPSLMHQESFNKILTKIEIKGNEKELKNLFEELIFKKKTRAFYLNADNLEKYKDFIPDINHQDDEGRTILHYCVENQKHIPSIAKVLRDLGAFPLLCDNNYCTPYDLTKSHYSGLSYVQEFLRDYENEVYAKGQIKLIRAMKWIDMQNFYDVEFNFEYLL